MRNKKGQKVLSYEKEELIRRVMVNFESISKVSKELKIKYQNAKGILYLHRKAKNISLKEKKIVGY